MLTIWNQTTLNISPNLSLVGYSTSPGTGPGINFYCWISAITPQSRIEAYDDNNYGSWLTFSTKINGDGSNLLRESLRLGGPSGFVGIGTANPSATLDVNGTARVNNTLQFTGGAGGTQTLIAGASSSSTSSAPFIHSNYDFLVGWSYNPNGNSYNDLAAQSPQGVQGQGISLRGSSNAAMIQICTSYIPYSAVKVGTGPNYIMAMNYVASVPGSSTQIGSITHTTSSVSYNTTSDGRRKTNITDMPSIIQKIKQLQPRYYNWKESGDKDSGFIAQEVHKIFPQFITVGLAPSTICRHTESDLFDGNLCTCCDFENPIDKDGKPQYYGLDYGKFTPYLTKALQETIDMVETQAKRIEVLEAQVTALLQK
jgi:hypothetical protein